MTRNRGLGIETRRLTNRIRSQRGSTAYVEYFLLAAAMGLAATWLWDDGNLRGATAEFQTEVDRQQADLLR